MPINKDTPTSEIIDDFVHSKNPKFTGKSKAERVKQAVAASYKIHKEEVELEEGDPIVRTKSFPGEPPEGTYADMRRKGTLPKPIQAKDENEYDKNKRETQKTFPNVKYFTKKGHPDWAKHDSMKEEADLEENAWNQLGQTKPVGGTLPAPKRGSVPKHGQKFSGGDLVVAHSGPHAGEVHKVTSSRAGGVTMVNPNGHKYDSVTVRAKHEHVSPANDAQKAKYHADAKAFSDRVKALGEEVQIDENHQYVEITNAHTGSKSYVPVHKTQAFAALNHYNSFSHNKGVRIIDKKEHDAIQAAKAPWNPSGESRSPFKEELELDEKVSPEMKQKIKDRMAALRTQDTKERHKIAKKQYERADEQVEESKNTPYVRPYNNEQGQPAGWKAMNKHGKTKWFGIEFKPAALRHAGLTEDTHQLDEALGRPPKAKGYTINPVNKQKLHHDNPEHMDLIRKLRKNGHLPPVDSAPKEHIINRLRQARTNMQGGQDITYENGKTHHVPSSMAAKTLDKYNGMKPADKEEFQAKIHRSHEDHKEAIKEEFMSEKKLTPKQKENLDKNHNGKIDKEDFIMLQKMKKEELMLQFAAALEEGIFDESDIDRLVENELAELDEAKTKSTLEKHFSGDPQVMFTVPKGKPKPAFTEPKSKSMKEEVEGLNEEPKMTAHTAAGRYHAVESAVRDIMAKNQDMRKLNQEETFKRNNPDRFKD